MNRELELLARRVLPLTFAVFGHLDDGKGKRVVRVGGSGVFIAPFLAVSARHVTRDLLRLDWRGEYPLKEGYFETEYTADLFQALDLSPKPRYAVWEVDRTWDTPVTDISLLQVSAEGGAAHEMQIKMPTPFFPWSLLPPPVGAEVVVVGYPDTQIAIADGIMRTSCRLVVRPGRVDEIHDLKRDEGMINFPSFRIAVSVDHGFSGGPVFHQNHLCGIVSSGSLDGKTYAATLWPFCLLEYEYPDQDILGSKMTFGQLFDSGAIASDDWKRVKDRISKRTNDFGKSYAYISGGAA